MRPTRSHVVSSFMITKGALIDETYTAFSCWDFTLTQYENLKRVRDDGIIGAVSASWAKDVTKVLNRRFDTDGRDRPLVELAKAGIDREVWKPLLLWHLTRDEFLVRDFLVNWLYPRFAEGTYQLGSGDVVTYLGTLAGREGVAWSGAWTAATIGRVASGLLRMAADFGLLTGGTMRRFASYHLPEASFLYLAHAIAESEVGVGRLVASPEWHMYLLDRDDIERQLVHLHQFRKLHYEVAGSLTQLTLPYRTAADYARELVA